MRRGLSALKMRQNSAQASSRGRCAAPSTLTYRKCSTHQRLTYFNYFATVIGHDVHDNGIEVEGLVREFKNGPRAVDGIDLRVAPGEIYGFLGPNGAGKSTTVLMLTTLLPPTAGTARVGGPRHRARGPRGARGDRRRAAGGRARPAPHRPRAHAPADHAAGPAEGRARARAATSCSSASA